MEKEKFLEILKKQLKGTASPEEEDFLKTYYNLFETEAEVLNLLSENEKSVIGQRIENRLLKQIGTSQKSWLQRNYRFVAAAAFIIVILYFGDRYFLAKNTASQTAAVTIKPIQPGGNKAILVLANGAQVALNDARGKIALQQGVAINKINSGQLVYSRINSKSQKGVNGFNIIITPKGGQYQVVLSDGTHVWLNAASSLRYPASFAYLKERRVTLTGEAYFEVAKNKSIPFIVNSGGQEIRVLGTHFNVNSYNDEPEIKTTLLEGSVLINNSSVLHPGEQASVSGHNIHISAADTELATAWKNNKFMFENEDIQSIMRMIGRWYDVDIIYSGNLSGEKFGGSVSRFTDVSKVLNILQLTGNVHFKIEERRIVVSK